MMMIGVIILIVVIWKLILVGMFYGALINWYYWLVPIIVAMAFSSFVSRNQTTGAKDLVTIFGAVIGFAVSFAVVLFLNWDEAGPWIKAFLK